MEPISAMTPTEDDCPICKGPLRDPSQLRNCEHVFCRQCLVQSLRHRDHCPVCRAKVAMDHVLPAPEANADHRQSWRYFPDLAGLYINTMRPVSTGIQSQIRQQHVAFQAPPTCTPIAHQMIHGDPTVSPTPASTTPNWRIQNPPSASNLSAPQNLLNSLWSSPLNPDRALIMPFATHPDSMSNHSFSSSSSSDDDDDHDDNDSGSALNDLLLEYQMKQLDQQNQSLSSMGGMFVCPYCQEAGLDMLELKDHCNSNHITDNTPVVCPVCVALPHGNPNQHSTNFIGHLNLRHNYYAEDYMNNPQSDMMNEQAALLESFSQHGNAR